MKVVIIDGQGGKLGQKLAEAVSNSKVECELYAVGTNTVATSAMLKGGAEYAATGENAVIVACRDADVIIGPIGITVADSHSRDGKGSRTEQGIKALPSGQPLQQSGRWSQEPEPFRHGRSRRRKT